MSTNHEDTFYEFLHNQSDLAFASGIAFQVDVLPRFAAALGYEPSNLRLEAPVPLQSGMVADGIIAAEETGATPWLIIETKLDGPRALLQQWQEQLVSWYERARPHACVLLTPQHIGIAAAGGVMTTYVRAQVTKEKAAVLYQLLKRPAAFPKDAVAASTPVLPEAADFPLFKVDLKTVRTQLDAVLAAQSNADKRDTLESLAATLMNGIVGTVVRRNLLTSSSEIDLLIETDGSRHTVLNEFGRYSIAECRNWATPVGAKHIRDLAGKLRKTKTRLAILFSRAGITGQNGGEDALREIHFWFDTHDLHIIVVSAQDLTDIAGGADFHSILDRSLLRLRFDIH